MTRDTVYQKFKSAKRHLRGGAKQGSSSNVDGEPVASDDDSTDEKHDLQKEMELQKIKLSELRSMFEELMRRSQKMVQQTEKARTAHRAHGQEYNYCDALKWMQNF